MKLYLSLLPILLPMILYWQEADAQSEKTSQFLTTEPIKFSGFGGPLIEISSVEDEVVVSGGAGAALLFNQTFYAGFYGLGTFKSIEQSVPAFQNVDLVFGHGGLWLGYIHQSEKLLHAGVSLKIGGGGATLFSSEGKEFDFEEENKIDEDAFFVLTPQAEMELNVAPWMKVNASVGYRYVSGVQIQYLDEKDFKSMVGSIGFYFGWFNQ